MNYNQFMVATPQRLHRYAYAEYVAIENESERKHEFLNGDIFVMSGGTENHGRLISKLGHLLMGIVGDDGPCHAFSSDMRIYVESVDLATFPDASVICGPLQQHAASPNATALNPTMLFEVTSDSSEEYDCTFKREVYETIPSLRQYVIVSHRERRIISDVLNDDGKWITHVPSRGEHLELKPLKARIAVDDIYRGISIP